MNSVDLSIQFQTKVGEENTSVASNPAHEEYVNHSLLEERQVVLYNRPRGITVGEQASERTKATLVT